MSTVPSYFKDFLSNIRLSESSEGFENRAYDIKKEIRGR